MSWPMVAPKRPWARLLLASVAAFLLGACAAAGLSPARQNPEARLTDRAKGYWEARMRRDLVAQYAFEDPWLREHVTLTAWMRGRGATKVLSYEIKEVRVQGEEGHVKLHVSYQPTHPQLAHLPPTDTEFEQQWVRVDGEWYLKYRSIGDPGSSRGTAAPTRGAPRSAEPKGAEHE